MLLLKLLFIDSTSSYTPKNIIVFIKGGEETTKITYQKDSNGDIPKMKLYIGEKDLLAYSKAYAKEMKRTMKVLEE